MQLEFEWDDNKNERNSRKHGVQIEEAATVYSDPSLVTLFDTEHSVNEERYINIGFSNRGRLLIVINTIRGSRIRIMSARPCTSREARFYDEE